MHKIVSKTNRPEHVPPPSGEFGPASEVGPLSPFELGDPREGLQGLQRALGGGEDFFCRREPQGDEAVGGGNSIGKTSSEKGIWGGMVGGIICHTIGGGLGWHLRLEEGLPGGR